MVQRAVKVISSQGKIFTLQQSVSSFRYLLTQQIFATDVSQKIPNCLTDCTERQKVLHRERFVKNLEKLNEVLRRVTLTPLIDKFIITDITCEKPKQKEEYCLKKIVASQRKIDMKIAAKFRDILKYDVMESNMLYNGDVTAKTREVKNYRRDTEYLT